MFGCSAISTAGATGIASALGAMVIGLAAEEDNVGVLLVKVFVVLGGAWPSR
jgi:hypothetical protein